MKARTIAVALLITGWACRPNSNEAHYPSPTRLGMQRSSLPAPGLCRVIGSAQDSRSCEGIANVAPEGSRVLYRMEDPSYVVVVCYMHPALRRFVYGIDVFNANNQRLLDVLLRADDEPIEGDCDDLVAGTPHPTGPHGSVTDRRRVGPWLRRYEAQEPDGAERRKELAVALGIGVGGLGVLIAVTWLFVRFPYVVLGALVTLWLVGYVALVFIRRRAFLRDQLIEEGHAFHEIRKSIRDIGRGSGSSTPDGG